MKSPDLQNPATACVIVAIIGLVLVSLSAPLAIRIVGGTLLVGGALGEIFLSLWIIARRFKRHDDE